MNSNPHITVTETTLDDIAQCAAVCGLVCQLTNNNVHEAFGVLVHVMGALLYLQPPEGDQHNLKLISDAIAQSVALRRTMKGTAQ